MTPNLSRVGFYIRGSVHRLTEVNAQGSMPSPPISARTRRVNCVHRHRNSVTVILAAEAHAANERAIWRRKFDSGNTTRKWRIGIVFDACAVRISKIDPFRTMGRSGFGLVFTLSNSPRHAKC